MTCKCGEGARYLGEKQGTWVCKTQYQQAVRGIERSRRLWDSRVIEEARVLGADLSVTEPELTDADLGMAAVTSTRSYPSMQERMAMMGAHPKGRPSKR